MAELLDSIGDGFMAFDFDWRVTYCNRAAEAHYNLRREDALGRVAWDLAELGADGEMRSFLERAMTARIEVEAEADSELRPGAWFHLRAFPIEDGLAVTFRDITERRQRARREREQAARLELALATSGFGDWRWDLSSDLTDMSPRAAELVGIEPGPTMTWGEMLQHVHPDDREPARVAVIQALTDLTPYEIEYRVTRPSDGAERWIRIRARVQAGDHGQPIGMFGVLADITDVKLEDARIRADRARLAESESRQRLLINELNHRVKNTLATIQSLARQTLREGVPAAEARERLTDRLLALSTAHNVLTRENWESAEITDIAREAVRPYDDPESPRIRIEGPRARLAPNVALAISMALHELATNAQKYGALSTPDGMVRLRWAAASGGAAIDLEWREEGGPPVTPPTSRGFGTRLLSGLTAELGAPAAIDYSPDGVVCRLRAPVT